MRNLPWVWCLGLVVVMVLLVFVTYSIPTIRDRLSWRMDFSLAYIRSIFSPVDPLPSALPKHSSNSPTSDIGNPNLLITNSTATILPSTNLSNHQPTVPSTIAPEITSTAQPSATPLPKSVSLSSPEWEVQDINNCGPASLTMYLRFYGWEGDQTTIADVIKPFREDRNVNVEELAYFVRNNAGWLNIQYRVGGDLKLLKQFLAAGIPVMIEESFYFEEPFWINDDLWAAHYLLVTGYNEVSQTFIGQDSYRGSDQPVPYKELDDYWQAFNRVYILIYLPQQEQTVKEILGDNWDPDVNRQNALEIAKAETQADSGNEFSWFNLGTNLTYFERYIEATDAYDKARELGLPQRMLRYQFGPFIAYFHTGQMDDLLTLTEYALKVTPNAEEAHLWHGWMMYRNGKLSEAIADFQQALIENPTYLDAQYALDFARGNP